jgi:hypothetical protein
MLPSKLQEQYRSVASNYPHVTEENFARILLLYHGINYDGQSSFPDHFTHYELIFTVQRLSVLPVLTLFNPLSPFHLIKTNDEHKFALLYANQFVDYVPDFEQRPFDYQKEEPFYFYVTEINGDLVLKLNPIQLCDFFQNARGELPCSFCFRNDMVQRFRNITAADLVTKIWAEESKRDHCQTLMSIDEISIVTGSYPNDAAYLSEVTTLVQGLKSKIRPDLRVVVGSHEGKELATYQTLHQAGVTVFAFPLESLDDRIRPTKMKNRKGLVPIQAMEANIQKAVSVFGTDGVILRLVMGIGDELDAQFVERVTRLSQLGGGRGAWWNLNVYMPFTHYHWRLFTENRPFDLDYIFKYCDIINAHVPSERQIKFKVSP